MAGYAEWYTGVSGNAGINFGGDSLKTTSSCKVVCSIYNTGSLYTPATAGIVIYHL